MSETSPGMPFSELMGVEIEGVDTNGVLTTEGQ